MVARWSLLSGLSQLLTVCAGKHPAVSLYGKCCVTHTAPQWLLTVYAEKHPAVSLYGKCCVTYTAPQWIVMATHCVRGKHSALLSVSKTPHCGIAAISNFTVCDLCACLQTCLLVLARDSYYFYFLAVLRYSEPPCPPSSHPQLLPSPAQAELSRLE